MNTIEKILVVSENKDMSKRLDKLISLNLEGTDIQFSGSVLEKTDADLIILYDDLPGFKNIPHIIGLSNLKISIIYIVKEEDYDYAFYRCHSYGILVLKNTILDEMLKEVIKLGLHSSRRKKRAASVYDKKMEISLIDVAKLLLITNENKNEDEAHRTIEKYAMDLRITKLHAAENIIGRYMRYE